MGIRKKFITYVVLFIATTFCLDCFALDDWDFNVTLNPQVATVNEKCHCPNPHGYRIWKDRETDQILGNDCTGCTNKADCAKKLCTLINSAGNQANYSCGWGSTLSGPNNGPVVCACPEATKTLIQNAHPDAGGFGCDSGGPLKSMCIYGVCTWRDAANVTHTTDYPCE